MNKEWVQEQQEKARVKKLQEKNMKKHVKRDVEKKVREPKPQATTIDEAIRNSKKLKNIWGERNINDI